MEEDKLHHELKSAEELHRFEAGIMVGQTAVYLVASGAMLNSMGKNASQFALIATAIFGIAISIAFLLIAHRTGQNLLGARNRAEEIGDELGFMIYSSKYRAPKSKYFNGRNITKVICFCGGILWVIFLVRAIFG